MNNLMKYCSYYLTYILLGLIVSSGAFMTACTHKTKESQLQPIDQLVLEVRDPDMKKLWLQAHDNGKLPPLNTIPVPEQPVSQRKAVKIKEVGVKPLRPVIPKDAMIAVQAFSTKPISSYEGRFDVISHKEGVIKGKLRDREELFEIIYKLPGEKRRLQKMTKKNTVLNLIYRDEVVDSALQRRLILHDPKTKRASVISISEGSDKPYKAIIKDIELVIEQGREGTNPSVKVSYKNEYSVKLQQGEHKTLGTGDLMIHVSLLNSYAQETKKGMLVEGQPYYINLIIYQ